MSQSQLEQWRRARIRLITEKLEDLLSKLEINQPPDIVNLLKAMRYSLVSGGKRLRPLLALAAADAIGSKETAILPGALAVEMIHAYSLIHDDLPALDNDQRRRGVATCHVVYGEATAILAGDALQSLAFETLAALAIKPRWAERAGTAIYLLAQAIGPLGMAGGQAEDLSFEKKRPSLEESLAMERRKTGELMAASLGVGAALAGADQKTLKIFRRMGLLAGEAYQIIDDLLNQTGDPQLLGKAVGSDAQRGKVTTPTLIGQPQARASADRLMEEAIKLATLFASKKLPWLLNSMNNRAN
ncbi:MAG: polyprenyl synthetase family protein [Deltaproteobacteria bacterium]|jgi:geranylgeranyl diphosphate synthase type II|nr:polyprenyl synthetase family protein [Deltaproteobacteria bacterium]